MADTPAREPGRRLPSAVWWFARTWTRVCGPRQHRFDQEFEGWVSFHFQPDPAEGFCAFDVHGVVVIVAGETTTVELPVVRVDTRIQPDDG